jgi:hypothetical protein
VNDKIKAAKVFKRARQRLGLTQEAMAKACGLADARVVRRYENSNRQPAGSALMMATILLPLVDLLHAWDGMSDADIYAYGGLTEMEADAVADLRKILKNAGIAVDKTTQ